MALPDKIKVKITRQENADFYGVQIGDIVEVSFIDYVTGVVASEVGNWHIETCKAQAVISRTYAYNYLKNGKPISDSSSEAQAFRALRIDEKKYPNAWKASRETDGLYLTYDGEIIDTAVCTHSNGGETVSAEDRWGHVRPYLIKQKDPWDYAATNGHKWGHGVGLSQEGSNYAASKLGLFYLDILKFYFHGCEVTKVGGDIMVKATYLIEGFQTMLREKWQYVWGGEEKGKVDCSGSFTYWYRKAGSEMYHGSNTMYRKWSPEKGKIGEIKLRPGMAVYKCRDWKCEDSDNQYYGDNIGNMYHVGLYIGNGQVIEAKGTTYGIVMSPVTGWQYASTLKDTDYDVEQYEHYDNIKAVVSTKSGSLNVRKAPSRGAARIGTIPRGAEITILKKDTGTAGWYYVTYKDLYGYVDASFVTIKEVQPDKEVWALKMIVGDRAKALRFQSVLQEMGLDVIAIQTTENGANIWKD